MDAQKRTNRNEKNYRRAQNVQGLTKIKMTPRKMAHVLERLVPLKQEIKIRMIPRAQTTSFYFRFSRFSRKHVGSRPIEKFDLHPHSLKTIPSFSNVKKQRPHKTSPFDLPSPSPHFLPPNPHEGESMSGGSPVRLENRIASFFGTRSKPTGGETQGKRELPTPFPIVRKSHNAIKKLWRVMIKKVKKSHKNKKDFLSSLERDEPQKPIKEDLDEKRNEAARRRKCFSYELHPPPDSKLYQRKVPYLWLPQKNLPLKVEADRTGIFSRAHPKQNISENASNIPLDVDYMAYFQHHSKHENALHP